MLLLLLWSPPVRGKETSVLVAARLLASESGDGLRGGGSVCKNGKKMESLVLKVSRVVGLRGVSAFHDHGGAQHLPEARLGGGCAGPQKSFLSIF